MLISHLGLRLTSQMKHAQKQPYVALRMFFVVGLGLCTSALATAGQQGQEVLNNEAIVSMIRAHVDEGIVITQIQNNPGQYNLTSSGLIRLAQLGVPKAVISAMQAKAAKSEPIQQSGKDTAQSDNRDAGPNDSPVLLKRWVDSDPKRDKWGGFGYSGSATEFAARLHLFLDKNATDYWNIPPHTFDREADYIAKLLRLCSSVTPEIAVRIGIGNVSIGDPEYQACGEWYSARDVTEKFRSYDHNRARGITLEFDPRPAWHYRYAMVAIVRFTTIPPQPAQYWDDATRSRNAYEQDFFPGHSEVVNAGIALAPISQEEALALSREINTIDTHSALGAPQSSSQERNSTPVATQVVVIPTETAMNLVKLKVDPEYSDFERAAHVTGIVSFEASVSANGILYNLIIVGGPPGLQKAAFEAVKKWTFRPYVVNGVLTPFKALIQVSYPPGN